MKKIIIFILALSILFVFTVGASAAVIDGGTAEPLYDINQDFRINLTISGGVAVIRVVYSIWDGPISNVKITVSLGKSVGATMSTVTLEGGETSHVYTSSALDGVVTARANISTTGTYVATAKIEVTNTNGSISTETLTKTVVYS